MKYFEQQRPLGGGLCSYPSCPCDDVTIARGEGYLYITDECVDFRSDALTMEAAEAKLRNIEERSNTIIIPGAGVFSPILVCGEGARLLELDLDIAAADAAHWWKTGDVPLRPTPRKKHATEAAGSKCLTGHRERVMDVALSRDGARALSCGWDGTVRLWDVRTTKELGCFTGHRGFVAAVAFSPDGRRCISGGADQAVRVWDVDSGRQIHSMTGHAFSIFALAFSPDGRTALSGAGDKTIRLWDVERGREIRRFGSFFRGKDEGPVQAVAFSPDGRRALSDGTTDLALRLWDVETGKEIRRFAKPASPGRCMAFFPDGRRAVTSSADGLVHIWDVETGREIEQFSSRMTIACQISTDRTYPTVQRFVLSSDGRRLLSTTSYDNGALYLFDLGSGRQPERLEGHTKPVTGLAMSADGRLAVSGSDDWTLRAWQLPEE